MKSIIPCLMILVTFILSPVVAYGPRGAAERILYYRAYLAEELDPKGTHKIAVDCGTTEGGLRMVNGGRRCNFNQFLQHIWAAQGRDSTKPVVNVFPDDYDIIQKPVGYTFIRLMTWKSEQGFKITGNADSSKIVQGATDFYDALKQAGDPVKDASAYLDTLQDLDDEEDKDKPEEEKKHTHKAAIQQGRFLLDQVKSAAGIVSDLRWKDMEEYRLRALNNKLPTGITVKTKPGRDTKGICENYNILDPHETINDWVKNHKEFAPNADTALSKLEGLITAWKNDPARDFNNRNHWAAVEAADEAEMSAGCA